MNARIHSRASFAVALVAALLLALSSTAIHAQAPQTKPKIQPPISTEVLQVKLPKAKEATLENGLRLVVLEGYDQLPTFTMQMVIMSGGLSDPPARRGLASATAALLREGTGKRTSREISEQVDLLGAALVAQAELSSLNQARLWRLEKRRRSQDRDSTGARARGGKDLSDRPARLGADNHSARQSRHRTHERGLL